MTFDVKDFGGIGDGRTVETVAIQKAVDACHARGGGTVVLREGTYLSGTITLRSNVAFCIDGSATLLGSPERMQYHAPEGMTIDVVQQSRLGLLVSFGSRNIAVTGRGTINGNGASFDVRGTIGRRPNLITLIDCRDVTISEVELKDAAIYACLLVGCSRVRVHGIRIDSRVRPNNDGIDVSSCEDVVISDCFIHTADDAIALKNDINRVCRNIIVTNCILSSRWAGVRIGPESFAGYENISVSHCVIHDTFGCGIKLQMAEGAIMQDLIFSDLLMKNVTGPISMRLCDWENQERPHGTRSPGKLRNVLIQNLRATVAPDATGHPFAEHTFQGIQSKRSGSNSGNEAEDGWVVLPPGWTAEGEKKSCISIVGIPSACIENVTLCNVHVTFPGGGTQAEADRVDLPEYENEYPEYFMFGVLPAHGFYARHARGLRLENVRFDLESKDCRPSIVADDVEDLAVSGLRTDVLGQSRSVIRLLRSSRANFDRCMIEGASEAFVTFDQESDGNSIHVSGNHIEGIPTDRILTPEP